MDATDCSAEARIPRTEPQSCRQSRIKRVGRKSGARLRFPFLDDNLHTIYNVLGVKMSQSFLVKAFGLKCDGQWQRASLTLWPVHLNLMRCIELWGWALVVLRWTACCVLFLIWLRPIRKGLGPETNPENYQKSFFTRRRLFCFAESLLDGWATHPTKGCSYSYGMCYVFPSSALSDTPLQ